MKKNKMKRGQKAMRIIIVIIGIIVVLNIISFAVNKLFFSNELVQIMPYGEKVKVDNKDMHIYSMGDGEQTIVLLPGLGVPLPSADFGPLMRTLSKEFTVVSIDYFGVGFSDQTNQSRTNENYTEEIRMALTLAGFKPPYILMPHSASGIYSEYYATKYPDEISAIIMLDTTSSAVEGTNVPEFVYSFAKIQQSIGITRILNPFIASSILSINVDNGYTKQEIQDYTKYMNHVLNDTIVDQNIQFNKNILEVKKLEFPKTIPVLKIVASGTIKQVGEEYQTNHINKLGSNAKFVIFDGTHFVYHKNTSKIYDATLEFLSNLDEVE